MTVKLFFFVLVSCPLALAPACGMEVHHWLQRSTMMVMTSLRGISLEHQNTNVRQTSAPVITATIRRTHRTSW